MKNQQPWQIKKIQNSGGLFGAAIIAKPDDDFPQGYFELKKVF